MQQCTYRGCTIYFEGLPDGITPVGLGMGIHGALTLVCRFLEEPAGDFFGVFELQHCLDCDTLQRHDRLVDECLLCGGALDWAEVQHLPSCA